MGMVVDVRANDDHSSPSSDAGAGARARANARAISSSSSSLGSSSCFLLPSEQCEHVMCMPSFVACGGGHDCFAASRSLRFEALGTQSLNRSLRNVVRYRQVGKQFTGDFCFTRKACIAQCTDFDDHAYKEVLPGL